MCYVCVCKCVLLCVFNLYVFVLFMKVIFKYKVYELFSIKNMNL